MGQLQSTQSNYPIFKKYTDGDIPREYMSIIDKSFGGYAYYKCSEKGPCTKCNKPTKMWFVTVKSNGYFICENCHNVEADTQESLMNGIVLRH